MLRCKMCSLWNHQGDLDEVNIEKWKNVINNLSKIMGSRPVQLHFGGGEPFLRDGIFDLIQLSTQKNFRTMVTSNGFLVDAEMAGKISDSGLTQITFSLDSLQEEVHDYLRGRKGSQALAPSTLNTTARAMKPRSTRLSSSPAWARW